MQFFESEKLLKSYKLAGGELRTFETSKSLQELRKEIETTLGKDWKIVEPPKVSIPGQASGHVSVLENMVTFASISNPKFRISITLNEPRDGQSQDSLLLLTITNNFKEKTSKP